ncbi:MAG: hypothetical protein BIFFINMI_04070 [Phycisphaerae bacterium]|nr:hypothetical protein [Phycisphaerae bacterium]
MAKKKGRNELIAGTFIVVAIVLFVGVLLVLADWKSLWQDHQKVQVVFRHQSVHKLAKGAAVSFRGIGIGSVSDVSLDIGNPEEIRVTLALPEELKIYTNASVYISTGGLVGGQPEVAISDVGGPELAQSLGQPEPKRAGMSDPIIGRTRPNPLVSDAAQAAGVNDHVRTQLQKSVDDISQIIAAIHDSLLAPANGPPSASPSRVEKVIVDLQTAVGRLDALVASVQGDLLPPIRNAALNVEAVTGDARVVSAELREKGPGLIARLDKITSNVDKLVIDQTPVLAAAIGHVERITAVWDTGSQAELANLDKALVQLNAALTEARDSLGNIRQITATARTLLEANSEGLSDTVANFQEGSDHFRATLAEVRRNPWRLLYRPKPEEVEQANVMMAARAFSEGATRLRDTTTRLSALVERADAPEALRDQQVRKMLADLTDSFQRFEKAQEALYRALKVP